MSHHSSSSLYDQDFFENQEKTPLQYTRVSSTHEVNCDTSSLKRIKVAARRASIHGNNVKKMIRNSFKTRSLTLKKNTTLKFSRRQSYNQLQMNQTELLVDEGEKPGGNLTSKLSSVFEANGNAVKNEINALQENSASQSENVQVCQ